MVRRDLPLQPRAIPSVQRVLERAELRMLCSAYGREAAVAATRAEAAALRTRVLATPGTSVDADALVAAVATRLAASSVPSLVPVINATGVVLHTNLGRAPLAGAAITAVAKAACGYSNLEFDLEVGKRGSRAAHASAQLVRLTGAEAALVVNNGAAAVLLLLAALAAGGEVVVSRGELVEIGGGFRIPEVVAQSGARLVEVGSTNRTRLEDYERVIRSETRLILKTHPSNYRIVGFTAAPGREALARLAAQRGIPFVEDLGSGSLVDLAQLDLPDEPTVQACLRGGANVVVFSGDKLLGGPQAGIIAGRKALVERAARHPLARALRSDKMTLAALGATLALYERGRALDDVPALRMLGAPPRSLLRRARALASALRGIEGLEAMAGEGTSLPGGGSLPLATLRSGVVRLRAAALPVHELARRLLTQNPPLVARTERGRVVLDVRTIARNEQREIPRLVASALAAA